MAKSAEKIIIDNEAYVVGIMPPTQALRILTRLTKLCGESLVQFIATIDTKDPKKSLLDANISPQVLSDALRGLIGRLDEELVVSLFQELCDVVLYKGQKVNFETHFMGRLGHMFKVSFKVLRVQFADFFGALPGLGAYAASKDTSQDLST